MSEQTDRMAATIEQLVEENQRMRKLAGDLAATLAYAYGTSRWRDMRAKVLAEARIAHLIP